jgi:hypothetical protein
MYIKIFIGIVWLFLEIKIPKFLCTPPAANWNANGIAMYTLAVNGKGSDWNGNANGKAMYTPCRERERDSYVHAFSRGPTSKGWPRGEHCPPQPGPLRLALVAAKDLISGGHNKAAQ